MSNAELKVTIESIVSRIRDVLFSHFRTYEECLTVRKHVNGPFILDENISDIQTIAKAWQDHAADVVNIKISKFGGITRAKQATEFCSSVGIAMTIEDTWGGIGSQFLSRNEDCQIRSIPRKYRYKTPKQSSPKPPDS